MQDQAPKSDSIGKVSRSFLCASEAGIEALVLKIMKSEKKTSYSNVVCVKGSVCFSTECYPKYEKASLYLQFPLLSKCMKLKKYAMEVPDFSNVELHDVPGGVDTFELCAKFCYGITITLNAYNVVAVRCAAEHLEMTEAADKGNLIFKVEVFLNACIFRGWRDTIIALQSTKVLLPWAEDLDVTNKCIDAISSKALVDPVRVDWTFSYTRATSKSRSKPEIVEISPWNGIHGGNNQSVPADWWVEDIAELDIDLYWRVLIAIKSLDRLPNTLLGEALQFYTIKWLPGVSKEHHLADPKKRNDQALRTDYVETAVRHRHLLEKVVSLLPPGKGCTSCSFLLKLLKAGMILGASNSTRMELARRAGLQLDEASVSDLLIPSLSYASDALYDVDLVQTIVEHFMMQDQSPSISPNRPPHPCEKRRTRSAENIDYSESSRRSSATHSSKLRVAKVIDAYLAEIARDDHLGVSEFTNLAGLIPDFARPAHDGLYRAIDIYLKEHPGLTKMERKRLCRLLNCKKLSMEACVHAAQNERLPLRVVVQVLFFEQVRASMTGGMLLRELPSSVRALMAAQECGSLGGSVNDRWDSVEQNFKSIKGDLASMKLKISEVQREHGESSKCASTAIKPGKFLCKLWPSKR
ncbi:hypothetical protein L7F22_054584 [Adiantum nelumboides]|nr:hypothetical protein [Adiantum nelumboides]